MKTNCADVDPRALREQCALSDVADPGSPNFLRFVVRFCEALDHDVPAHEWRELATLHGCFAYLRRVAQGA